MSAPIKPYIAEPNEEHTIHARILRMVQRVTGLHRHLAEEIAKSLEEEIRREFAGERYVAYMSRTERALRRMQIRAEYNGHNAVEVCRKHRISRRMLQRYLKQDVEPPAIADEE